MAHLSKPLLALMELTGVNFRPGIRVQAAINQRFGLPVSLSGISSGVFFLVASFGRCKFHLCSLSMGLLHQATIGGIAQDFCVLQLAPRVFRFSVSSKNMGFYIFKLASFECSNYKIFFHLWGNGGPRWDLELAAFNREDDSWMLDKGSQRRLKRLSYVDAVKSGILTGANSLPVKQKFSILTESNRPPSKQSVFDRLIFPKDAWGSHAASPDRPFYGWAQNSVRRNLVSREKPGNSGCGKAIDSTQMDLNLTLDLGMPPSAFHPNPNLSWIGSSRSCSRCLSNNHSRSGCKFK